MFGARGLLRHAQRCEWLSTRQLCSIPGNNQRYAEKVVIVTGAARGIGYGVAEARLLDVVIIARNNLPNQPVIARQKVMALYFAALRKTWLEGHLERYGCLLKA